MVDLNLIEVPLNQWMNRKEGKINVAFEGVSVSCFFQRVF